MILPILLLLSGLAISGVAEFYSIMGLMAIFSAAQIPVAILGISLGVGKLVVASWLKAYWSKIPTLMKLYGVSSVGVLMLITTLGCFGFLSKAHSDQSLVGGDIQSKITIIDEKIKTARENIEADRKQLKQMDESVDQVLGRSVDEKGADKANKIRKSQQNDRILLASDIENNQKLIARLNDEAAPIRAENRKVEAEVGPIKYIAAFIYGANPDSNVLERAVTWVIILITIVFDPLAVVMLLASQMTFIWWFEQRKEQKELARLEALKPKPVVVEEPIVEEQIIEEIVINDNQNIEPVVQVATEEEIIAEILEQGLTIAEPGAPTIEELFDVQLDEPENDNDVFNEPTSEIEKWNRMIEEAEKALLQTKQEHTPKLMEELELDLETDLCYDREESTVQERVARGETYIDHEGNEVDFDVEVSEVEPKETYMTKDQEGQVRVEYVQNQEQNTSSIWSRITGLSPTDQLYKEWSDHKFEDFDSIKGADFELDAFIEQTKKMGPQFSDYPTEKIAYFEERINELRKNHVNNTAG
jgi:hypothetical protein